MVSETAILGGGLAGGAAALLLARGGARVRLLEREAEPHDKVCGEFLSIEAQRDLARLGLDTARLGAVPIEHLRLCAGGTRIEARLPFVAQGISRKLLDEALLEMAAMAGAEIERGVRATGLEPGGVATNRGPCPARRVLLATGKHDLRGARRTAGTARNGYVGFKMHWQAKPGAGDGPDGGIDVILFPGGYAGLQPIAAGVLNLCLIVRRERLAEAGGTWEGLLTELMREPAIARRLGDARPLFAQPLAVADLPYGYVCGPRADLPGHVFRLGDQAAMTASLTGDGMAIALRSAHLAAAALASGEPAGAYHARLARTVSGQVRRAMLLQRATEMPALLRPGLGLLRLWPGLLARLAEATRLPHWQSA